LGDEFEKKRSWRLPVKGEKEGPTKPVFRRPRRDPRKGGRPRKGRGEKRGGGGGKEEEKPF